MILKSSSLIPEVKKVISDKATEHPFTGHYNDFDEKGTYLCRQCGLALFRSQTKFHSMCGWPSFDEEIKNSIEYKIDSDGIRTEILCHRCHAHLGHAFQGEHYTVKNFRHCVNSVSLDFVKDLQVIDTEEAIFAAGCFWGVEALFKKYPGVLKTEVGYTGGHKLNPTYEDVCQGKSGHLEAIRIIYDPIIVQFSVLVRYFFEIHDPTQKNGQGPDLGQQYESAIFYYNDNQLLEAKEQIELLKKKNYVIATHLLLASPFWPAEEYHQDYYGKSGKQPYCHFYKKRF